MTSARHMCHDIHSPTFTHTCAYAYTQMYTQVDGHTHTHKNGENTFRGHRTSLMGNEVQAI